jgi:ribosomal protein S18 acetylase RimI-like enzyme
MPPSEFARGLSKPLLSAACERLCALGYTSAFLITSTTFVPAVNLYRQFGFEPAIKNKEDRAKWLAG